MWLFGGVGLFSEGLIVEKNFAFDDVRTYIINGLGVSKNFSRYSKNCTRQNSISIAKLSRQEQILQLVSQ